MDELLITQPVDGHGEVRAGELLAAQPAGAVPLRGRRGDVPGARAVDARQVALVPARVGMESTVGALIGAVAGGRVRLVLCPAPHERGQARVRRYAGSPGWCWVGAAAVAGGGGLGPFVASIWFSRYSTITWSGLARSQPGASSSPSWNGRSHVRPLWTAVTMLDSRWHIVAHL